MWSAQRVLYVKMLGRELKPTKALEMRLRWTSVIARTQKSAMRCIILAIAIRRYLANEAP